MPSETQKSVKNGDNCHVVDGTHVGKSGVISDLNRSKTGHLTVTVTQANGVRLKTLAKNVMIS